MKIFYTYIFITTLLFSCNNESVALNENCIVKKVDSEYHLQNFLNILKNEYTNTKYNIGVKNILVKKIKENQYEIKIYLIGNIDTYLQNPKYKFFIYMYPEDKNIINLPENRVKFGFDVWETNMKLKSDINQRKHLQMVVNSKLENYEFIAFGIINKKSYKRIFVMQEKNINLIES